MDSTKARERVRARPNAMVQIAIRAGDGGGEEVDAVEAAQRQPRGL
jgi:hypothetical protein